MDIIANFGLLVAQSVRGGQILRASHHDGDLWHPCTKTLTEVKAAGMSAGAIVVQSQLERHCLNSGNDYVVVFYQNCGRFPGIKKRCHLPFRMATSHRRLERFLVENIEAIYIVPSKVVRGVYDSDPKRIKKHEMGPKGHKYWKIYRKISPADLWKIVNFSPENWAAAGLDSADYRVHFQVRRARFRRHQPKRVPVYWIRQV